MKQLIIICLLGLAGCENSNTITWKSFYTYDDMRLPDSICRFGYNSGNEFQDSCKLYHVGDTIKSK